MALITLNKRSGGTVLAESNSFLFVTGVSGGSDITIDIPGGADLLVSETPSQIRALVTAENFTRDKAYWQAQRESLYTPGICRVVTPRSQLLSTTYLTTIKNMHPTSTLYIHSIRLLPFTRRTALIIMVQVRRVVSFTPGTQLNIERFDTSLPLAQAECSFLPTNVVGDGGFAGISLFLPLEDISSVSRTVYETNSDSPWLSPIIIHPGEIVGVQAMVDWPIDVGAVVTMGHSL